MYEEIDAPPSSSNLAIFVLELVVAAAVDAAVGVVAAVAAVVGLPSAVAGTVVVVSDVMTVEVAFAALAVALVVVVVAVEYFEIVAL